MPVVFPPSGFGRTIDQTAKAGVTVTGGVAHTQGTWVTLIDPLSFDCFGLYLQVWGIAQAATNTGVLANIGVAPTGGGSEQIVIPYLDFGATANAVGTGKLCFFPLYVPAGKAIRAQIQGVIASETCTMRAVAFGLPPHGFAEDAPQEWTQYGAVPASSIGTGVTSGSSAYGTEVQVTASTTRSHRWFHIGLDFAANTVITGGAYRARLAKDTGGTEVIGIWDFYVPGGNEEIVGPFPSLPVCYPLPAGEALYVDVDGPGTEALGVIVYAA